MRLGLKFSNLAAVMTCASALLVTACAGLPQAQPNPEQIVQERAKSRWAALIAGNWEKAYSLTAPSYRAVVDKNAYRARIGKAAAWVGADVVAVTCKDESCIARVRVDFRPIFGMTTGAVASTHFDETWVMENDGWWLYQKL